MDSLSSLLSFNRRIRGKTSFFKRSISMCAKMMCWTIKNTQKTYKSRTYLISMLFCQFSKNQSVRDISSGLGSATDNLNHLGQNCLTFKSQTFNFFFNLREINLRSNYSQGFLFKINLCKFDIFQITNVFFNVIFAVVAAHTVYLY